MKPILLLILDGWGHREAADDNAISAANCPNWRSLWASGPRALIRTDGLAVGLPEGQMGNSEVGHMNLGAGRIVYQDLTRIDLSISDGSFYKNSALNSACSAARRSRSCLHVFGLVSDGGVHSHEDHLLAMLQLCQQRDVPQVRVHAFLDGRDTPPKSAARALSKLQAACDEYKVASIATVSGRYFAMDRDKRWDRVQLAYEAIANANSTHQAPTALAALEAAYARGETDEFVKPTIIGTGRSMADDDAVVFMNFRSDRARELSQAFVQEDFSGFSITKRPQLSAFVTLTEYASDLAVTDIAFAPQTLTDTLPELVAAHHLKQLRIAETEKYAHVTFFFNGGAEEPYVGESRILVPSPKVATYDLQPEMSCPQLTDQLVDAIASQQFDLIICNIANPDMVGHTGVFSAAVKAVEAVDVALGRIQTAIASAGGVMLVTADHGNLEEMWDASSNQPNTQHSMNPVPLVLFGTNRALAKTGSLQDIAPTILELLSIPKPDSMTGQSLLRA